MGDGGILSTLGYKNMWPKLKDMRSDDPQYHMKALQFCSEKRVSNASKKTWVGNFCSMAMAAHAHDLIAEAFSWTETSLHYGKSDVLIGKARELQEALGENYDLDDKGSRKKIVDFANNYANMFPCSDSKHILMECFRIWVSQKGSGDRCIIRIEKPVLPGHESEDRLYPPTLLPPVPIPESLKPRESPYATREPTTKPPTQQQGPFDVLGTNELKSEMNVEPDLVSRCVMSARGDLENKSTIPCIYQQWTWCTRTKDEMNQRRWRAGQYHPYASPETTFDEAPKFTTTGYPQARFTLLNLRVFDRLNPKKETVVGPSRMPLSWGGTYMQEYVQVDDGPMVEPSSNHVDLDI